MAERMNEADLSVAEINALEKVRPFMRDGAAFDAIDYRPEDPALFTSILLYQSFPDLLEGPSVTESYGPADQIIGLVKELDDRIVNQGESVGSYADTYEVKDAVTTEWGVISVLRDLYEDEVCVIVDHVLHPVAADPYVERERFILSDDGYFNMMYLRRHASRPGYEAETVSLFTRTRDEVDERLAESLNYFTDLIEPFLAV